MYIGELYISPEFIAFLSFVAKIVLFVAAIHFLIVVPHHLEDIRKCLMKIAQYTEKDFDNDENCT